MSYQTSSKRSPPFWLLIGARKLVFFALLAVPYFSSCLIFRAFRLCLAPTICPWVCEGGATCAVCHVFVTQSSLKRLFHVTRVISSEREFRSGLSQFHRRNEVKQGHKVQKINCSPDYILERIDIWCRFWKLRCFMTWPKYLKARIRVLHSQPTKWYEKVHLIYMKRLCITVGLEIA